MKDFKACLDETGEVGHIVSIAHSVIYASGLPSLKIGEEIITEGGKRGIVHGLSKRGAEILIFDTKGLKTDEAIARTGQSFRIPASESLLGRIINPLGKPIDGLGPIIGRKELVSVQNAAPKITERARVNRPLETGVVIVDLLVPIGYGQRELVIGDEKTGKSTLLLQSIVSQAKKNVVCVYVLIGKRSSDAKMIEDYLKERGVFESVTMIVASPDNPATVVYLAPYSGMAIAEYFRDIGKDSIIILDDLSSHAKAYREISLLLKRIPGRSSYPGDVFHIHAELMERAGNVGQGKNKETSITAFPVAETLENEIGGYIQTNLMAMTDGHVFFDINEHRKGRRPAINAFLSVSRVGNQTKNQIERELAGWIRKKMAEYQKASEVAQFGADLPEHTKQTIELGEKIYALFNQNPHAIMPRDLQLIIFGLLLSGFWEEKSVEEVQKSVEELLKAHKRGSFAEISGKIKSVKSMADLIVIIKNSFSIFYASIGRN